MKARILLILSLCALVPTAAMSQALTSLASVRVGYTTRKNTVKPQGDLKAQIDALDAQIAEAGRLGRNGELRRLYAKGIMLLSGRPWTDAADYSGSLVLRTARVVVDSSEAVHRPPRADLCAGDRVAADRHRTRRADHAGRGGAEPAPADARDRERPRIVRRRRARSARVAVLLRPRSARRARRRVLPRRRRRGRTGVSRQDSAADRRAQGRGRSRRPPRGRRGARARGPARGNPVPRRSHAEREPRAARAAHVRSRPGFRGCRGSRGRRRRPERIRSRAARATSSATTGSTPRTKSSRTGPTCRRRTRGPRRFR